MSRSATPGRFSEFDAGRATVLSFSLGSRGTAAREFSGLPSSTRRIGLAGRMTVDLPTLTRTTGATSTRAHGVFCSVATAGVDVRSGGGGAACLDAGTGAAVAAAATARQTTSIGVPQRRTQPV